MIRRARWGTFSLLLAPCGAWALGLGDIELRSALNQPLDANIELVSATPEELADLRVALASPETFGRYGLDRPGFLARINFRLARDEAGRSVIHMSSLEPIAEPFVTVLVEATWNRGRLLREYTVLLDPPVMLPAGAAVEPVQPATARAPQPAQPAADIERQGVAPPAMPATTGATPTPRAASAAGGSYGPVQRGETLWGIAAQFRPAGVTMNQMMVAMYQANPAAFQGNMNVLRQGATLDVPASASVSGLSAAEATQEVLRQASNWSGAGPQQQVRLRLLAPEAEAGTSTAPGAGAAPGGAAAPGADAANVAALENQLDSLRGELAESQRLLSLRNQELSELQRQLSEARTAPVADLGSAPAPLAADPGVELEAEEIFADEAEPADAPGAPEAAAEVPAPAVAEPPAPVLTPTPSQVVSTPPAPSLLSRVLGWLTSPLVWMIAGLGALVGVGVWYLRTRQADGEEITGRWEALEADDDAAADEAHEATARLRADAARRHEQTIVVEEQHTEELPQATESADEDVFDIGEDLGEDLEEAMTLPEPDADSEPTAQEEKATAELPSFTPPTPSEETLSSQTVINLDQADPIAEADFHMAYGLYDQAADLINKALESNPDSRSLRLKLLEVYFVWGNREAFLDTARILRAAIGEDANPDWDKVVIMGKQICPDEELFADATAAAGSIDLDLAAGDSPALDLAFDEDSAAAIDLDLSDDGDDVTLELESSDDSGDADVLDIGESAADDDLEIGARTAAGLEAAFADPPADASAKTSPNLDIDGEIEAAETARSSTLDAETLESPTLEFDSGEAPTVEALGPDAPTMESPQLKADDYDDDAELPTIEQPHLESEEAEDGERTAEIDLDDLGLDVDDLAELDMDAGDGDSGAADAETEDADVLSATGVTQVLSASDDGESKDDDAQGDDTDLFARTEVLHPADQDDTGATAQFRGLPEQPSEATDLDIDLDELSAALDGADTVEQPAARGFTGEIFDDDGATGLDLDIGEEASGRDEPTATEEMGALEPQTLTEVGTKLDLARAYIDMGDPEGARSILEEVLDEGDTSQKQEAKGLIDAL